MIHYAIPITQKLRKLVRSLNQKQNRDQHGLFVAEGIKLCQEAYDSDFTIETVVVRDSPSAEVLDLIEKFADEGVPIYNSPKHQFDQMSTTKSPQGIVAVVTKQDNEMQPGENFAVLDGINDPGNMGTIIRTCEWFGINQIIVGNESADHFNPKAVRSSMGAIFRVPVVQVEEDLLATIKTHFDGIEMYGATLGSKKALVDCKPKGKFGLVFGSESHGISEKMLSALDHSFTIKGIGRSDSLNVAVASGITFNHFAKFIK